MLGLSGVSNFAEVSSEPIEIESDNEKDFEEIPDADLEDLPSNESSFVNNYNNELVKQDKIMSPLKDIDDFQDENNEAVVKRPFLRRGAGLTTRFRIPPDAFNLKKLPPYKYTERIRKSLTKQGKRKSLPEPPSKKADPQPVQQIRKSDPVKTKTQAPSGKTTPEATDLVPPPNVALKIPAAPKQSDPPLQKWFDTRVKEKQQPPELLDTLKVAKLPKGVSWASILSAENIADSPINIEQLLKPQEIDEADLSETSLFHLLEDRVNNMSLDTSMSSIMQMLAALTKAHKLPLDEDHTLVNPEDPIVDDAGSVQLKLQPLPSEVDDTTDDDLEQYETEDESASRPTHVRFSNKVEVVEEVTDLSSDLEATELSQTSTPNERKKFEEFQRRLTSRQHLHEERDDIKEKSELLKTKLQELEAEIRSLRTQNANAVKMREEIELERIQIANDREDMIEQLKDDRIKMELQLHDERLKLEQERQKFEKAAKNPNKKEREEIAKLKETIEELKAELKEKEARHGSSSARYRSQIKQLEKENQTMKLELEAVKKDNKKLELENARLRKDTNNKMLQEINRNIAKLAPTDLLKQQPEVVKKPVSRKSEPINKKPEPAVKRRGKSVPELHVHSSSESSDDDSVTFSNVRRESKENNPVSRRSDPVKATQSSSTAAVLADLKREIVNSDGSKDIWYPNGNLKKISPDGMMIRMLYFNKDIKETNIHEGTVKYYYNETNTWHTTYIDGLEILEYPE